MKSFLSAFILLSLLTPPLAQAARTHKATRLEQSRLVGENLWALLNQATATQTAAEIQADNQRAMEQLEVLKAPANDSRLWNVPLPLADAMVGSLADHPVVGLAQDRFYDPEGARGFCFGRALFMHHLALRYGVSKAAIRKVWIVGPMYDGYKMWGHHVATLVHTADGWMALDSLIGAPIRLDLWYKKFFAQSPDGKLKIFITNPEKFGPEPGAYSRTQLGLLEGQDDYYNHYFKDLMYWLSHAGPADFASLGLPMPTNLERVSCLRAAL